MTFHDDDRPLSFAELVALCVGAVLIGAALVGWSWWML